MEEFGFTCWQAKTYSFADRPD